MEFDSIAKRVSQKEFLTTTLSQHTVTVPNKIQYPNLQA